MHCKLWLAFYELYNIHAYCFLIISSVNWDFFLSISFLNKLSYLEALTPISYISLNFIPLNLFLNSHSRPCCAIVTKSFLGIPDLHFPLAFINLSKYYFKVTPRYCFNFTKSAKTNSSSILKKMCSEYNLHVIPILNKVWW